MATQPGQRRSGIILGALAAALFSFGWLAVSGGLPGGVTHPLAVAIALVGGDPDTDPTASVALPDGGPPALDPVSEDATLERRSSDDEHEDHEDHDDGARHRDRGERHHDDDDDHDVDD